MESGGINLHRTDLSPSPVVSLWVEEEEVSMGYTLGTNGRGPSLHDLMEKLGNGWPWSLLSAVYLILVPSLSSAFLLVEAKHSFIVDVIMFWWTSSHLRPYSADIFPFLLRLHSSFKAHLEPTRTSPSLGKLSRPRLDWQLARARSRPALSLSARARRCSASVAMARRGQSEASHVASCVLFTEGSWAERGSGDAKKKKNVV